MSIVLGSTDIVRQAFFGGSSGNFPTISSPNMWQNIENASMTLRLDYDNAVLIRYSVMIEGLKTIDLNPLPRENRKDTLQIRCLIDNTPYRSSSSYLSTYATDDFFVKELSGVFAANLSATSHIILLQWKKTGNQINTFRIAVPSNSLSYSLSAVVDYHQLWFDSEFSNSILNVNSVWKGLSNPLHFIVEDRNSSNMLLGYSVNVQPQLASFIKDGRQDYISSRILVDGIPFTAGSNTFSTLSSRPSAGLLIGSISLSLSPGRHYMQLQWFKIGDTYESWGSNPSYLDGFASHRNLYVISQYQRPDLNNQTNGGQNNTGGSNNTSGDVVKVKDYPITVSAPTEVTVFGGQITFIGPIITHNTTSKDNSTFNVKISSTYGIIYVDFKGNNSLNLVSNDSVYGVVFDGLYVDVRQALLNVYYTSTESFNNRYKEYISINISDNTTNIDIIIPVIIVRVNHPPIVQIEEYPTWNVKGIRSKYNESLLPTSASIYKKVYLGDTQNLESTSTLDIYNDRNQMSDAVVLRGLYNTYILNVQYGNNTIVLLSSSYIPIDMGVTIEVSIGDSFREDVRTGGEFQCLLNGIAFTARLVNNTGKLLCDVLYQDLDVNSTAISGLDFMTGTAYLQVAATGVNKYLSKSIKKSLSNVIPLYPYLSPKILLVMPGIVYKSSRQMIKLLIQNEITISLCSFQDIKVGAIFSDGYLYCQIPLLINMDNISMIYVSVSSIDGNFKSDMYSIYVIDDPIINSATLYEDYNYTNNNSYNGYIIIHGLFNNNVNQSVVKSEIIQPICMVNNNIIPIISYNNTDIICSTLSVQSYQLSNESIINLIYNKLILSATLKIDTNISSPGSSSLTPYTGAEGGNFSNIFNGGFAPNISLATVNSFIFNRTLIDIYGSGFTTKIITGNNIENDSIYNTSNTPGDMNVFEYPIEDSDLLPEYVQVKRNITVTATSISAIASGNTSFEIFSIIPNFGSTLGGTVVVVYGESFVGYESAFCLFGNTSVPALILNETALECMSSAVTVKVIIFNCFVLCHHLFVIYFYYH
jgi:hypothetical protein